MVLYVPVNRSGVPHRKNCTGYNILRDKPGALIPYYIVFLCISVLYNIESLLMLYFHNYIWKTYKVR
jgi:hypothetical protein